MFLIIIPFQLGSVKSAYKPAQEYGCWEFCIRQLFLLYILYFQLGVRIATFWLQLLRGDIRKDVFWLTYEFFFNYCRHWWGVWETFFNSFYFYFSSYSFRLMDLKSVGNLAIFSLLTAIYLFLEFHFFLAMFIYFIKN